MKTHFMNQRLFVNAGIRFPECYTGARLLDMDKTRLPVSGDRTRVTCKRCVQALKRKEHA